VAGRPDDVADEVDGDADETADDGSRNYPHRVPPATAQNDAPRLRPEGVITGNLFVEDHAHICAVLYPEESIDCERSVRTFCAVW
jgi:hypothetical protein